MKELDQPFKPPPGKQAVRALRLGAGLLGMGLLALLAPLSGARSPARSTCSPSRCWDARPAMLQLLPLQGQKLASAKDLSFDPGIALDLASIQIHSIQKARR